MSWKKKLSPPPEIHALRVLGPKTAIKRMGRPNFCGVKADMLTEDGGVSDHGALETRPDSRLPSPIAPTLFGTLVYLDSPLIAASLERSDFSFREVAEHCGSAFLVLPPDRIHAYAR